MASSSERSYDEALGLAPGTLALIHEVEAVAGRVGLAQRQQVLAFALWRTTARHPSFAMTADFEVDQLVVREGGRDIRAEVRVFPPKGEPVRRKACPHGRFDDQCLGCDMLKAPAPGSFVEPTVTWRGSVPDLVTDLLAVLGADRLFTLANHAQQRVQFEMAKGHGSDEGESDGVEG